MARSSSPFDDDEQPELSIAPLIDVAFLLLIYFLVTTTLEKKEADLALALPGVASIQSERVKVDQMLVQITAGGAVLVNKEVVDEDPGNHDLPNLTDRFVRYAASAQIADSEPMVIIECHDEANEQRFVDVLNTCAKAGIVNISITQ